MALAERSAYIGPMTRYTSDPRRTTADTAETMADVRYEIDRLDRLLVEIIKERQSFMDAAARIKGSRDAVLDRWRIEDVVTKVKAAADAAGLSPAIAEPVWRTMIDRCIAYEFESYDARAAREDQARENQSQEDPHPENQGKVAQAAGNPAAE